MKINSMYPLLVCALLIIVLINIQYIGEQISSIVEDPDRFADDALTSAGTTGRDKQGGKQDNVSTVGSVQKDNGQEGDEDDEDNEQHKKEEHEPKMVAKHHSDTKLLVNAASSTDRTKSIVAARLGVMEVSPDIVEEMKKVDISIVISHCDEDLSWIPEYIGKNYSIKDIKIYSKCGEEAKGLEELQDLSSSVDVIRLPNIGRCDHTYANWIKNNYKSIRKEMEDGHGNDIVMFLKGNNRNQDYYVPIDLLFSHVSNSGFGCVREPTCDCNGKCIKGLQIPSMQHDREYLTKNFTIGEYQRVERDENEAFLSEKYTFLGDWKEDMGMVIPESETMPVCYGGLFAAQKRQILNQPEETWEKMESSLSRADNIVEGHFAERLWASILSDVDIKSAKAVDKAILPRVINMVHIHGPKDKSHVFCGMAGMLYHHYTVVFKLPSSPYGASRHP